jgi:Zn/Cd-binding protein ZinT
MVYGWILSREGEEMNLECGKCGLRIECNTSIDSTLRLLDYGINNIKHIQAFKDSILSLPKGVQRPLYPDIPNSEIDKALTLKLNHRKEVFIRRAIEKYNKEFKNKKSSVGFFINLSEGLTFKRTNINFAEKINYEYSSRKIGTCKNDTRYRQS